MSSIDLAFSNALITAITTRAMLILRNLRTQTIRFLSRDVLFEIGGNIHIGLKIETDLELLCPNTVSKGNSGLFD
jgi:hypothetical protein